MIATTTMTDRERTDRMAAIGREREAIRRIRAATKNDEMADRCNAEIARLGEELKRLAGANNGSY